MYLHHIHRLDKFGLEIDPNKSYLESFSLCGLPLYLVPAFRGLKKACKGYTRYYFNGYAYDFLWWGTILNDMGKYGKRIEQLTDAFDINYQKIIIMRPFWKYLKPSVFLLSYFNTYNWCLIGDTIIMKQFVEELFENRKNQNQS